MYVFMLYVPHRGVDPNVIAWNRVILLHGTYDSVTTQTALRPDLLHIHTHIPSTPSSGGPPGTGKTSLCKALSQKLSIRLSDRYSYGQLVEINSHSLFSKWFSEVMAKLQTLLVPVKHTPL